MIALIGRFVKTWGLAVLLGAIALGSWEAAKRGDTDNAASEPVIYDRTLATPMLSARRVPLTLQAPVADENIRPEIREIIDGSPPTSCVMVQVGDRVIEASSVETGLLPASNEKVLTTYAALLALPESFRYETRVVADVLPDADGIVDGNLYFVGAGDPYLGTNDWWSQYGDDLDGRFHTRLEDLADAVAATGVTQVTGQLLGDESLFDEQRAGPWPDRHVASNQSGPLSALAVNEGFVDWPAVWSGTSNPRTRAEASLVPVEAAAVLGGLLVERGVTIGAGFDEGVAPVGAAEIAMVESPPLLDVLTHINSFSSNFGAEMLLKYLGVVHNSEGSTAAGAAAVTDLLVADGVPLEGLVVADGSGLADTNRVTCQALVAVLTNAGADSPFAQTLSISAERGSLSTRFEDTLVEGDVYAKTGTLNDSNALSGYVHSETDDDLWITFAYVANGELISHDEVRDLQNSLVVDLSTYPGAPALADLDPLEPIALAPSASSG